MMIGRNGALGSQTGRLESELHKTQLFFLRTSQTHRRMQEKILHHIFCTCKNGGAWALFLPPGVKHRHSLDTISSQKMRRGIISLLSVSRMFQRGGGEGRRYKRLPFPQRGLWSRVRTPSGRSGERREGKGGWWRSETDTQRRAAKGIGDRQAHAFFAKEERTKIEKWLRTWVRGCAQTRSGEYDKFLFLFFPVHTNQAASDSCSSWLPSSYLRWERGRPSGSSEGRGRESR